MFDKLDFLRKLRKQKQSKSWYAHKLQTTENEIEELLILLKVEESLVKVKNTSDGREWVNAAKGYGVDLQEEKKVNVESGTLESSISVDYNPKSIEELYKLHKIDEEKYTITSYWSKLRGAKFTSSVLAKMNNKSPQQTFSESFKDFLSKYIPSSEYIYDATASDEFISIPSLLPKVSLVLPKQDAHYNKFDIYGDNSIEKRFSKDQKVLLNMLIKASSTNLLDEVVYIVGSDQFNSEWTSLTTKGTPQQNILTYQEAFTEISNHEVIIINTLLRYSNKVRIVYIPGNHDEYVGWHLVNWLETYFREFKSLTFDTSTLNTKYHKYGDTAIMFNHGDAIKPKELAQKFPIGFKDQWSSCNHQVIITGDKHHELSMDIHGIKFFQVPQLSSAKSKWDDKQGYIDGKAEMTAFVISETNGITDIYKTIL